MLALTGCTDRSSRWFSSRSVREKSNPTPIENRSLNLYDQVGWM